MRVLVVEDEPDLLTVLSQALREQGYAVDTASNGRDGLFKAQGGQYDGLILDLMLPLIDGLHVLKQLRTQGHSVPVLLLTARDSLSDRVRGLDTGADDYVVKPFDMAELLARLRAIVRRAGGTANPIIELGEIRIDTTRQIVLKNGQEIALTPREYSLVELLALQRDRLVTRNTIYDHLFDEEDDSLSNLVDVHISNVRKKLGKDFIITRRGRGYMISNHISGFAVDPEAIEQNQSAESDHV